MDGKLKTSTIISDIFSLYPDYAMIVVSKEGITEKTKEQFEYVSILKIPFFFIVNKTDLFDENEIK